MAGLFFYLFLNLILYSTPLNNGLLKIWSIESCLFSILGLYIAARYTWRICELDEYRKKNQQIERELQERQKEEESLRRQVALDSMTGLNNRQCAEDAIASLMEQNSRFVLCFLDLDGLKNVNDRFGHDEGDRYIMEVTEQIRSACRSGEDQLFRYGGDEFLVLFAGMELDAAQERADAINARLCALAEEKSFPYELSLSYGVIDSKVCTDWRKLIQTADQKMYGQKMRKRVARDCDEKTDSAEV